MEKFLQFCLFGAKPTETIHEIGMAEKKFELMVF